jgi:hypothetical protein
MDSDDPEGILERWNYENRQRRLILREMVLYNQVARWFLPFYDNELIDFWTTVPIELRLNQKLYINCLLKNIFIEKLQPLKDIPLERGPLKFITNDSFSNRFLLKIGNSKNNFAVWNLFSNSRKFKQYCCRFQKYNRGPDAIESWWETDILLRNKLLSYIIDSPYLKNYLDMNELGKILNKSRIPSTLLRTGIPSLLSIHFVCSLLNDSDLSKQ